MKINLSEKEIAALIKCIDSAIMFWISHRFDPLPGKIEEKRRLEGILLNDLKEKFCKALLELSKKEGKNIIMKPKVNIKSNFSKTIVERVFDESIFMMQTNETLKVTASRFNVSISTVWRDMRKRLPLINLEQYKEINRLINFHKGSVIK